MRCPECQGKNVEELNDELYYCNDCGANIKKHDNKQTEDLDDE